MNLIPYSGIVSSPGIIVLGALRIPPMSLFLSSAKAGKKPYQRMSTRHLYNLWSLATLAPYVESSQANHDVLNTYIFSVLTLLPLGRHWYKETTPHLRWRGVLLGCFLNFFNFPPNFSSLECLSNSKIYHSLDQYFRRYVLYFSYSNLLGGIIRRDVQQLKSAGCGVPLDEPDILKIRNRTHQRRRMLHNATFWKDTLHLSKIFSKEMLCDTAKAASRVIRCPR